MITAGTRFLIEGTTSYGFGLRPRPEGLCWGKRVGEGSRPDAFYF